MGTDDRHKKKKARNTARKRVEQKAVLIALEDTKSSKYYFESLVKDKKLSGQVIFAKHIGTNPKMVLDALLKHKHENSNTKYEKEWLVIDRDDWSKEELNSVLQNASRDNICVALSNESYELWILLHFESVNRHISRGELNSKLKHIFLERFGMEYAKSSKDIYSLINNLQSQAIKNAKSLVAQHIRDYGKVEPFQNPMTMIYELVECLNSLYTEEKNCECFPY